MVVRCCFCRNLTPWCFCDRGGPDGWQKAERVTVVPRTFLFSDQDNDGAFRDFSLHTEFRLPGIFVEDFNGDGFPDLLLTEQETVTVYLHQRRRG